jgi:hypothetical protein
MMALAVAWFCFSAVSAVGQAWLAANAVEQLPAQSMSLPTRSLVFAMLFIGMLLLNLMNVIFAARMVFQLAGGG